MAGYTTYRDLGSEAMGDFDANVRDAIARGLTPGPRLFVATRVLASTENPDWYARQLARLEAPYRVEGPDALKDACRRLGELVVRAAGPP